MSRIKNKAFGCVLMHPGCRGLQLEWEGLDWHVSFWTKGCMRHFETYCQIEVRNSETEHFTATNICMVCKWICEQEEIEASFRVEASCAEKCKELTRQMGFFPGSLSRLCHERSALSMSQVFKEQNCTHRKLLMLYWWKTYDYVSIIEDTATCFKHTCT